MAVCHIDFLVHILSSHQCLKPLQTQLHFQTDYPGSQRIHDINLTNV